MRVMFEWSRSRFYWGRLDPEVCDQLGLKSHRMRDAARRNARSGTSVRISTGRSTACCRTLHVADCGAQGCSLYMSV